MTDMKSIRFPDPAADDMVRAILNGRKTVTRRAVKLKYSNTHLEMRTDKCGTRLIEIENEIPGVTRVKNPDGTITLKVRAFIERTPPYRPGDILYVRETWVRSMAGTYLYRATDTPLILDGWCPSIHMPREAARIFLRVTDIRVERLQDIDNAGALAEGFDGRCEGPQDGALSDCQKVYDFSIERFSTVWNSTIKPADRALYGWEANPWVWVIEFERCEKPEGG